MFYKVCYLSIMCDFLDVQCNMTFFYALFLQCPARVLVCLLCLRTPCREAFSWLCGVISIPNHRSYYSMSYIYSRFTMVTVTEWVTRNMLSREVYTFFLIICCRTSSPVEVFWADHLCFNLSAEKKIHNTIQHSQGAFCLEINILLIICMVCSPILAVKCLGPVRNSKP